MPGIRTAKGYPLTKDELISLGGIGAGTTAAFTVGSFSLQYYLDVGLNLALAQGIPEKVQAYYEAARGSSLWIAVAFYVLGVVLFVAGGLKVIGIMRQTKHNADQTDVAG